MHSKNLNIDTLQAICNIDNKASNHLLKKLGFVFKDKISLDEKTEGIYLYELMKEYAFD